MTDIEIDKALIDILAEKKQACEARLAAIPKENKTEKKALHLELGMYTLCQNAEWLRNTGSNPLTLSFLQNFLQ